MTSLTFFVSLLAAYGGLLIVLSETSSGNPSSDCPPGCVCQSTSGHVSCEKAALTEVPRIGIGPSVTSLDLAGNQLMMLTSGSLSALRNVVRLKLNNNEIEKILDGAFESTPSLQTLDLSGNNLTVVQQHTFRGAEKLLHLDLSDNKLNSVDGAFAGLRELSRLDLRSNRLTEISQFTFRDQTNLRYLLLSENHISHIDRRAFRNLEKLTYLVLRKNPIGSIDKFQFHSLFLSYVDLSECGLATVPRGLPASIRYLQLRRNNISIVQQNSFRDCPYVSILVLDENNISEIENGAFENMHYLQQLRLNHNNLRRLTIRLPASVQRLLIESNSLLELSRDVFPPESQLSVLSLAGNNLPELPAASLSRLSLLRSLDVSVNNIRRLYGGTFANNTRLRALQLSRNPLEYLYSGCFHGLSSLRQLAMAFIPSISVFVADDAFRDITGLTVLDMDSSPALVRSVLSSDSLLSCLFAVHELGLLNSHLTRLRPDFPTFFQSLVVVRLSSARWQCDAEAAGWLKAWISSAGIEVIGAGEIRCATPVELRGRSVLTLADWELQRYSEGGGDRRSSFDGDLASTIATAGFSRVRPVTSSYWSEYNRRHQTRPIGGQQLDYRHRWSTADDDRAKVSSSKSADMFPFDGDDTEFDFIDRSDDVFRSSHGEPRWNADDEHFDFKAQRQKQQQHGLSLSTSPSPTSGTLSTTKSLRTSTSGADTSISSMTRATPVERRELEPRPSLSRPTTYVYQAAESDAAAPSAYLLPSSAGDSRAALIVIAALSVTVIVTVLVIVVVVVVIIRLTAASNRKQAKAKLSTQQQQQQQQQQEEQLFSAKPAGCCSHNNNQRYIAQNCILVSSSSVENNTIANCSVRPSLGNGNYAVFDRSKKKCSHQLDDEQQIVIDKQSAQLRQQYEPLDDVITAVITSSGATASGSAEALSLIPGRDINHEGPHLVYQWTDF